MKNIAKKIAENKAVKEHIEDKKFNENKYTNIINTKHIFNYLSYNKIDKSILQGNLGNFRIDLKYGKNKISTKSKKQLLNLNNNNDTEKFHGDIYLLKDIKYASGDENKISNNLFSNISQRNSNKKLKKENPTKRENDLKKYLDNSDDGSPNKNKSDYITQFSDNNDKVCESQIRPINKNLKNISKTDFDTVGKATNKLKNVRKINSLKSISKKNYSQILKEKNTDSDLYLELIDNEFYENERAIDMNIYLNKIPNFYDNMQKIIIENQNSKISLKKENCLDSSRDSKKISFSNNILPQIEKIKNLEVSNKNCKMNNLYDINICDFCLKVNKNIKILDKHNYFVYENTIQKTNSISIFANSTTDSSYEENSDFKSIKFKERKKKKFCESSSLELNEKRNGDSITNYFNNETIIDKINREQIKNKNNLNFINLNVINQINNSNSIERSRINPLKQIKNLDENKLINISKKIIQSPIKPNKLSNNSTILSNKGSLFPQIIKDFNKNQNNDFKINKLSRMSRSQAKINKKDEFLKSANNKNNNLINQEKIIK